MAPVIHLIRHAQGVHNLGNHHVRDATLTDHGLEQCATLAQTFPFHDRVKTIVVSPLRRAIYTALYGLEPAIRSNNVTMIANPVFQETGHAPCDTGLEPEDLLKELQAYSVPIETTLIVPGWNDRKHGSPYCNSSLPNSMRAKLARRFLRGLILQKLGDGDNSDIAVVCHGGFLHYLTEDWEGAQGHESVAWSNTEFRSFTLAELDGNIADEPSAEEKAVQAEISAMTKPEMYSEINGLAPFHNDFENATLVETRESRQRRGAAPVASLTREQNRELWLQTVSKWQASHIAHGWENF